MDFQDIVLSEFKSEDVETLNEGWFPITPFLAYASFKRKMFDKFNKNKMLQTFKKIKSGEIKNKVKGEVLSAKEKVRHELGVSGDKPDSAVYRLTPEQISVLADISDKYGKKLLNEIYSFRKNILAPYQVIKRLVKENKTVSMKDRFGLSYEEYKSALESGRRKILKRKDFIDDTKGKTDKIGETNNALDDIRDAIKNISSGKGELSDSVLNKIYQELDVGEEELQGYSLVELKNITDELARNYKALSSYISSEGESMPPEDVIATIERNIEIRGNERAKSNEDKENKVKHFNTSSIEDVVKEISIKRLKKGNINVALAKYMLRKEIREKIKSSDFNSYKKMYLELLKSLVQKLSGRKKDYVQSAIGDKLAIEFTEKEKKVWGKLFTTKADYSGNLEDYYQKITDTSLKDVEHIHKPDELVKAQQEIENEIKRFERKLAHVIDVEDLAKLKKYRLINNLITVKEMSSPESLFKTQGDLQPVSTEEVPDEKNDGDAEEKDKDKNYTSESEFVRRLEELTTMEFDTITELNNAKEQVKKLVSTMEEQGDGEIVKKYQDVIKQMELRRTTEKKEITGNKYLYGEVIDIDMIESFARNMLKKKYANVDEMKQDKIIFEKMLEKYKKEDPEAERNLAEIDFLISQTTRKFEGSLGRFFGED